VDLGVVQPKVVDDLFHNPVLVPVIDEVGKQPRSPNAAQIALKRGQIILFISKNYKLDF